MKRIKISFAIVLVVASIVLLFKLCFLNKATPDSNQESVKKMADLYAEFMNSNIWKRDGWKTHSAFIDSNFCMRCDGNLDEVEVLHKYVEVFLAADLKIEDFIAEGAQYEHYVLFCRDLLSKMYEFGIDEKYRIKTFFSMMEKYKSFCLQKISEDVVMDRQKMVFLYGSTGYLRRLMKSNVQRIDREIFISYLPGLSKDSQNIVKQRYVEFLKDIKKELEDAAKRDRQVKLWGHSPRFFRIRFSRFFRIGISFLSMCENIV
jgi:hypothetical protein